MQIPSSIASMQHLVSPPRVAWRNCRDTFQYHVRPRTPPNANKRTKIRNIREARAGSGPQDVGKLYSPRPPPVYLKSAKTLFRKN